MIDGSVTISIRDYEKLKEKVKDLEFFKRCLSPVELYEHEPERWKTHQERNYSIKNYSKIDATEILIRMKLKLEETK